MQTNSPLNNESTQKSSPNKDFWEMHVKAFSECDDNKAKYCRQNGINYNTFTYWQKKCNQEARIKPIPVTIKPSDTLTPIVCTVELKNGIKLLIHDRHALIGLIEELI